MDQATYDMVDNLPKPETLEEQYMYSLVCDLAEVTPKYGISENAFTRREKYWLALWKVLSYKISSLEPEEVEG